MAEPVGTEYQPAGAADAGPDRVDAINQMFAEFQLAYHNQYRKAYPDDTSLVLAKKYWLSCLSQYSPLQIARAARQAVKTEEFLPSVAAVVRLCESGLALFGLPDARSAYEEACRATSPKSAWPWSHEAVYFAGKATDWFILASEPESVAFPRFEYQYHQLCQRVMRGERLDIEAPPALPEHSSRKLSREENRERLRKLRDDTGV